MNNDLTQFFKIMLEKNQIADIAEGILQDVQNLTARVSFVGNPVSQEAFILQGAIVSVGNRCLCVRPKSSSKWIVLGSFGTRQTGYSPQIRPEDGYEIYPPGNLVPHSIIPGCCMWSWNSPAEKAVIFEVQTNTTADEDGAVTMLKTRGSMYIVNSEVNLFIRVRSITSTYKLSSWSAWVECEPAAGGTGGGSGIVESIVEGAHIDVDATDPANPVVSVVGVVEGVTGINAITIDNTDTENPIVSALIMLQRNWINI